VRRLLVLPLLAAGGLLLAGCANVDGRQPASTYVAQAEKVCKDINAEAQKLKSPRTKPEAARYIDQTVDLVREEADRLHEIEPLPRARVATARALVQTQRQFARVLERSRDGFVTGLAPDRETAELLSGLQTGSLTLAQAKRLEKRFPALEEVVTALENAHAARLVDLGQTTGQQVAQKAFAATEYGRAQQAIAPAGQRLQTLNQTLGTTTCFGAG
jgi:hypothetical protein